jgi:uncharacterized protein
MKKPILLIIALAAVIAGVVVIFMGKSYTPEQKKYISSVEKERSEKNDHLKNDDSSPFKNDERAHYAPLKYFDVDPSFVFKSRMIEYDKKDTVTIFGTKGDQRKVVRYGFVEYNFKAKKYKLNVYKGKTKSGMEYFVIWFTDKTTGDITYGVGRYLDFELNADKGYVYTIDFNRAYNPYCAYSGKFSCAIPTKEDHVDMAVKAGEKNFH